MNFHSAGDSWFLSVLYALCLCYEEETDTYFKTVFAKSDIKADSIVVQLWRGGWTEYDIEPLFPIKHNELRFVHSKNRDVYWSTLLQKAYAK